MLQSRSAILVVVDVQVKLLPSIHGAEETIGQICRLVRGFRIAGAPILLTEQYRKGLGETEPELFAALADLRKSDLTRAQQALLEMQTVTTRLRRELNGVVPVFNKTSPVLERARHTEQMVRGALEYIHQHGVRLLLQHIRMCGLCACVCSNAPESLGSVNEGSQAFPDVIIVFNNRHFYHGAPGVKLAAWRGECNTTKVVFLP